MDAVTGENKIWVLSSFVSRFFRSLTCPGLESLGHRVDTVTVENKIRVLSSLVVYFFPSGACRVLVTEWLPLNVRTKYGDCQVPQVLHRTSVLLLCTPWLRSLYHFFKITVTDENKVWVLMSLESRFFSCLTFPGFTSLDHRVITVTGENTVCVLSSRSGLTNVSCVLSVSYFFCSVTCSVENVF